MTYANKNLPEMNSDKLLSDKAFAIATYSKCNGYKQILKIYVHTVTWISSEKKQLTYELY